jgi:hypothetical protein
MEKLQIKFVEHVSIVKKYKVIYLTSDYSNSSYNTTREKSIEVLIVNY